MWPSACVLLAVVSLAGSLPAYAVRHPPPAKPSYRASIDYRVDGYRPHPVPSDQLPEFLSYAISLDDPNRPVDVHGVALWLYNNHQYYHPLVIARYGLALLEGYRITHDPAYLDRAKANADFLIKRAVRRNGALYFPYRFRYGLFGNPSDPMRPPWYSAMTQGAGLTLFLRLYQLTGDRSWRKAADATFATFLLRRTAKGPWTVFAPRWHRHSYLWFEEYPKNPPTQPLNGHLYGLFGVYEYALATRSAKARKAFDGGATAVRHMVERFRVPGGISYYSIRVHVQYDSYHCVHIGQLKLLALMTGDSWFAHEAQLLASDAPEASSGC